MKGNSHAEIENKEGLLIPGMYVRGRIMTTATENYAVALGKNAKDLTQFEKSQAIANEVLTQAEQKYSSIWVLNNSTRLS